MFGLFVVRRNPAVGPEYEAYPPGIDRELENYMYNVVGVGESIEISLDKILIDIRGELHMKGELYTEHDYDDVGIKARGYLAHKVPDRIEGYYVVAIRDKDEDVRNDYLEPVLSRVAAQVNRIITQLTVVPIKEVKPDYIQRIADLRRNAIKQHLPSFYKLVFAVARGDEETLYPVLLEEENARNVFLALRDEPIITLNDLVSKVSVHIEAPGGDFVSVVESILRDFENYGLVRVEEFEERGRVVFLVRDLFAFRKKPPAGALPNDEAVLSVVKTFFENYLPSPEDERRIILTMANPFKNTIIKELRKGPKTFVELRDAAGVSEDSLVSAAIQELVNDEFVMPVEQEGEMIYVLKTDVYIRVLVPKRLRRRAAELYLKRRELQELVLRYLDILDAVEIASR